jgi:hypothetical protein
MTILDQVCNLLAIEAIRQNLNAFPFTTILRALIAHKLNNQPSHLQIPRLRPRELTIPINRPNECQPSPHNEELHHRVRSRRIRKEEIHPHPPQLACNERPLRNTSSMHSQVLDRPCADEDREDAGPDQ